MRIRDLKRESLSNIRGNWGRAVGTIALYLFIVFVVHNIAYSIFGGLLGIVSFVIIVPMAFGIWYSFATIQNEDWKFSNLFRMFKDQMWWKSIAVVIVFGIGFFITILPIVILNVIGLLEMSDLLAGGITQHELLAAHPLMTVIATSILLLLLVPCAIYSYTYSQVVIVSIETESKNIKEIFKTSRMIMRGNKWRLFGLQISFIGWFILSIFTIYIGLLWLLPYFITTQIEFYRGIASGNNKNNFQATTKLKINPQDNQYNITDLSK